MSTMRFNPPELNAAAEEVGKHYYFRKFPEATESTTKLLDYTAVPEQEGLVRRTYGLQSAARAAALIPHLLNFYQKQAAHLTPTLQVHAELAQWNKLPQAEKDKVLLMVQIVTLMSYTGRRFGMYDSNGIKIVNPDQGHGKVFAPQAMLECQAYLVQKHALSEALAKIRTRAIEEAELPDKKNLSLMSCLVADALMIEKLRSPEPATPEDPLTIMRLSDFAIAQNSNDCQTLRDDFVALISRHLKLIKEHQGFLLHGVYENDGKLVKDFPALNTHDQVGKVSSPAWLHQAEVERTYSYEKMADAVDSAQLLPFMRTLRDFIDEKCDQSKRAVLDGLYSALTEAKGQAKTVQDILSKWNTVNVKEELNRRRNYFFDLVRRNATTTTEFIENFKKDYGSFILNPTVAKPQAELVREVEATLPTVRKAS